jgi:hypothetical protein
VFLKSVTICLNRKLKFQLLLKVCDLLFLQKKKKKKQFQLNVVVLGYDEPIINIPFKLNDDAGQDFIDAFIKWTA